jgi:flagellar motor switch protein FliN/FliY
MTEKQEVLVRNDAAIRDLAPVFDIPLQISVEVGRTRLRVRDLIRLTKGAVIELKKQAGDPFEICVNGVQIARGEVIGVDQLAAVRVVEVQKTGVVTS